MRKLGAIHRRGGRYLAICGAALLVAACTTAELRITDLPVNNLTPEQRHPLTVERSIATLAIPGDAGERQLSASETSELKGFFREYRADGRGQLMISVPGNDGDSRALARGRQVASLAVKNGLRADEVVLRLDTARGPGSRLALSYETFTLRVPKCGYWGKEPSHDVTNTDHPENGCSTQRNAGLMIAHPADIVDHQPLDAHDTPRSDVVIQEYRKGKTTTADRAKTEKANITEFAN